MPLEDVLVHRATPIVRESSGEWVEGEEVIVESAGTPFDCCLFLPQPDEPSSPRGGRKVTRPTLLVPAVDDAGGPVYLAPEDELDVRADELAGALNVAPGTAVRWQVVGGVQPFGKPGEGVIGGQVTLLRVED